MDGIVAPPLAGYKAVDPALEVIVTSTTGDLSWLSAWKDQLNGAKVLVAHDASVTVSGPPQGIQVELVPKRADVPKLSARDLAVLAAKAPWILFLAEGTSPATAPDGQVVQVLKEHITNLNTPATPFFFNTLYDPFRAGADFVRGYPFSLRDGVKTVVSHGLSLGQPDLDAATLLAKPLSRNDLYVDATLTVPKESLALFSARNLAVDKSRIGIALYSGLDSDNIWTSLTLKALSNHLGYGCKTGLPYVTTSKPTASQAPADLQALAKFQEQVIAFFQQIQLTQGTTAEQAYLELAGKVKQQLGAVDPYFIQVADGMEAWSTAYKQ